MKKYIYFTGTDTTKRVMETLGAEQCPTKAISHDDPNVVDASRCITCMRCTYVCPTQARQLPTQMQEALTARLSAICTSRREIEAFWA